jgi:hypothetical protein
MTFQDTGFEPQYGTATTPSGAVVPRIVVHPRGAGSADPYADFPIAPKGEAKAPTQAAPGGDPYADFPTEAPQAQPPSREVGIGEALGKGFTTGASFGFAPAIEGLAAAAGPDYQPKLDKDGNPVEMPNPMAPIVGAAKLIKEYFSDQKLSDLVTGGHHDVADAYTRGREAALADQNLAKEQHPQAYLAGQLAGVVAMPVPGAGAMKAATVGARAIGGLKAGAIGGGLYGAGEATSEGQAPADVAKSAGLGAAIGGPLGAGIGAAVGPRVRAALTPGEQAGRTAEIIGAPLTKGLISDSPIIQRSAASTSSAPYFGARMGSALEKNREAAGNVANASGIQSAIDANKASQNALYDNLRGQINPDAVMPMPRTAAMTARVMAERAAERRPNPGQGLEQFEAIGSQGASFNGAHRARVTARNAGSGGQPNPGYDKGDYDRITRAMTADIRDNVGRAATNSPQRAQRAFDQAEKQFGPFKEANDFLRDLLDKPGPTQTLEKLGYNPATGHFSLDKFVTAMDRLSPDARPFVPSPGHRASIESIFQMGRQIKNVMGTRNTSHTSNALILFDLAQDAVVTGAGIATGLVSVGGVAGGIAGAAPALMFMHWLSSPAIASSMSAWSRVYRAMTLGTPTPARIAAFNVATRNLANNLGLPVENVMRAAQRRLAAPAGDENQNQQ